MRDVFEEYAEQQKILTAIETARYFNISEEKTLELIIKKFNLSEKEALEYMQKKSA